jgi:uncharacterized membrane protein
MVSYFWFALLMFGVVVLIMGVSIIFSGRLLSGHNETTEILGQVFLLIGMVSSIVATIQVTDWKSPTNKVKV